MQHKGKGTGKEKARSIAARAFKFANRAKLQPAAHFGFKVHPNLFKELSVVIHA